MKIKYLFLCYFAVCIKPVTNFAQESKSINTGSDRLTTRIIQYTSENKSIGLSHLITDSLTYTELLHSYNITVENPEIVKIKSYVLTYIVPNSSGESDIVSMGYYNDELPQLLIQKIVITGVDKILIENVIGTNGEDDFKLGHRWFYLK